MFRKDWAWALLGLLALVIRYFAAQNPERTEEIYSRTFFPVVRNVIDLTVSRLPFPTVYLFVLSIFIAVGIYFYYLLTQKPGVKMKVAYTFRSIFNFSGALIFFFLILWGYNYQRVPIFQQLDLSPRPLSEEEIMREINLTSNILVQLRQNLTLDEEAIEETLPYEEVEDIVRANIRENLYLLGLNFTGHPRTKLFYPAGFMTRMGILGIYFPFTGESYIDAALHPLERPFTVAHEMAHSYGVTDEGEANFIGWVICANSNDPLLQYSGQLRLLRYQLSDLYRISPNLYRQTFSRLNKGIKNDLSSILKNKEEVKPISNELSKRSNDIFLKTQGVKAGVMSYQQLPMLANAWRNRLKGE
ncbi:DUF3810 domain-containing protein [Litoribacter ruber]|uniref:DUF3810 domain-containing protein n=1 Tax=Litoribacter ruber TaxID=702568 RepID=A0AAP2G3P2_9BACT|nr:MULTISPECIES: DUF3810 domain-containing protein [Litoribacter]MBS9523670.1 DUF3810 domain-containing protein [Litoribacter alkaliphilus]MBT0812184.1 DUF3810 domain-containing protein [Litoribacter ruber]